MIITNDGATILKEMAVVHPTARMVRMWKIRNIFLCQFVELSKAQDIEAGDGTTSVVVIAGALLEACEQLLDRGLHPQTIAEAFLKAADRVRYLSYSLLVIQATEILKDMSTVVDLTDRESLVRAATTSLSSKVVSQNANLLAPMAVDAVLRVRFNRSSSLRICLGHRSPDCCDCRFERHSHC